MPDKLIVPSPPLRSEIKCSNDWVYFFSDLGTAISGEWGSSSDPLQSNGITGTITTNVYFQGGLAHILIKTEGLNSTNGSFNLPFNALDSILEVWEIGPNSLLSGAPVSANTISIEDYSNKDLIIKGALLWIP